MKRDHAKLICDIGELSGLFQDAPSMDVFLQKIVELIADHMSSDVCSIYLYYEDQNELVLKATKGLNPSSVNNVRMKLGEGLTGKAMYELRPIYEGRAKENPNFRFFPGIGEERFESLLAVPILRGQIRIGVIVIQSVNQDHFTADDIYVFRAITSQLANTIETAKLLMSLDEGKKAEIAVRPAHEIKFVKGRIGCEGVSHAPAFVMTEDLTKLSRFTKYFSRKFSLEEFRAAVEATEKELTDLQNQIESTLYDVASLIFTAQILMLKDKVFIQAIEDLIAKDTNPPEAIIHVVEGYVRKLSLIDDAYLREKIHDIKDVSRRLLENLIGAVDHQPHEYEGKIIIAPELLPSDAIKLYSQLVKGIIVLSGGATSHLAILSRSLNIPLVIADEPALMTLPEDTPVLLDAVMGQIHVQPDQDLVGKIMEREELHKSIDMLKAWVRQNPQTRDGTRMHFWANINLLGDLKAAKEFDAEGVGLYRTEFPFLMRSDFPTEEEQYQIYRRLLEGMKGKEVTFRTLDIGGDKVLSYYNNEKEENPFLGLRSIRFSLQHKEIFAQQIRAILRAGHGHAIRIMFPMISSLDEFYEAKAVVEECKAELMREEETFHKNPQLGMMVELPAVLEIIDELTAEADFLSIGTNDLIQYILAVDRTNEKVADLYMPHHPAVLRALKKIAAAAGRYGKQVCICGDMAHDPKYLAFFVGIGIRHLSLDPRYLPQIHQRLIQTQVQEAEVWADRLLKSRTVAETSRLINGYSTEALSTNEQ
jgi:phosphotransferase system, enzyme I, PtsP